MTARILLLVLLAAVALVARGQDAVPTLSVVLGSDPNVVDMVQNTNGEVYNLQGLLESIDVSILNITEYNSTQQWESTLPQAQVVVFPEVEADYLTQDLLQPTTIDLIRSWVRTEGGVVVIFADGPRLANSLLGQEVIPEWSDDKRRVPSIERSGNYNNKAAVPTKQHRRGGGPSDRVWEKSPQAKAMALFRDAPEQVQDMDAMTSFNVTLAVETFPEFMCIYGTVDDCVAWMLPDGAGFWFSVGPDYYDSAPFGEQDGGWVSVLTAIVKNAYQGPAGSASRFTSWLSYDSF